MMFKLKNSVKYFIQKLKLKNFFIWKGVYDRFEQVEQREKSWESGNLELIYYENILKLISQKNETIPYEIQEEYTLLPLLISSVHTGERTMNILDFGGGLGISYFHMKRCVEGELKVNYYIVETKSMCYYGDKITELYPNITFHTEIPKSLNFDVIYISSALQYIKDYNKLLEELCLLKPKYFFLVKLSTGKFPTYYSKQVNEAGCEIPYIFININEILGTLKRCGYSLIFKSVLQRSYNQDNFPSEYRMNKASNLLFQRL